MSDFSLTLALQIKTSKIINDMAKVQIKSEKVTPFGGIFHVREPLSHSLAGEKLNSQVNDSIKPL